MDFQPLSRKFYHTDTLTLPRLLLGMILVHFSPEGLTAEWRYYLKGNPFVSQAVSR